MPTRMTDLFLSKIKSRQATLELGNKAFAEYIGVSRQIWEGTIRETDPIPVGPTLAYAALHSFPDLHDAFLAWTKERRGRKQRAYTRAGRDNARATAADAASALAADPIAERSPQEATR